MTGIGRDKESQQYPSTGGTALQENDRFVPGTNHRSIASSSAPLTEGGEPQRGVPFLLQSHPCHPLFSSRGHWHGLQLIGLSPGCLVSRGTGSSLLSFYHGPPEPQEQLSLQVPRES